MDNLLRLRFIRYRQTPCNLKRANVHAVRRELSTSVLDCYCEILPISIKQESKSGRSVLCPYIISAHRHLHYLGFNNIDICRKDKEKRCKFQENKQKNLRSGDWGFGGNDFVYTISMRYDAISWRYARISMTFAQKSAPRAQKSASFGK